MSDQKLSEDLAWLRDNAFECMLSFNNHRINGTTVAEDVASGEHDEEEWISPEARAAAIEQDVLAALHVYPCGSVSSFNFLGVDIAPLAAAAREHCQAELDRWEANGAVPIHRR